MSGKHVCNVNNNYISLPTLDRGDNFTFVKVVGLPKTRDIWVPHCVISPDHFTCFFISGIETLFQSSNEQTFSLLPIVFQDLVLVVEGEHQEFFD